ncbi:unnamed protein product [Effrenium voratum]|uniref:Uncharacterized protein n=1 Tax=Effrenium voratum TaxID=2562239 RepID=A0AA36J2D0_9DINO|nr:unnamed protein product [Effrenium voratum]CAJ1397844.1 unnamed protein product [Effrenium voratum]CAJ1431113.1 unnamed protein product [Effrenium voratum]|mmetsp:Transcript_49671/g.118312  ORF Transcript_49671/g.118312 Transcript_49671/m.118312 type:complete len:245 (+) Transcript_49671:58-792(+)
MNAHVSELIQLLSEKEQEKVRVERRVAEKVKEERLKVDEAAAESMRLQRALTQEAKDAKAQLDKALREQAFNCKTRVHQELRSQAAYEGQAERARMRAARVQDQCYKLSLKIQDLQCHLQERTEHANSALHDLEQRLHERTSRVSRQGEQRSQQMRQHAMENSVILGGRLDHFQKCCTDQMRNCHTRAEGHSRYKELCQLAETRDTYTMSRENYRMLKGDLLALWKLQHQTGRSPSPRFAEAIQ